MYKYYPHKIYLSIMSTKGSESNNAVDTSKLDNICSHVTALAGSNLSPQV